MYAIVTPLYNVHPQSVFNAFTRAAVFIFVTNLVFIDDMDDDRAVRVMFMVKLYVVASLRSCAESCVML